jgi:flagella basal body P-ring formation protein FlgA
MIALLLGTLLSGTVALRADTVVSGPTIEIAEVAELRGFEAEAARRVGAITLGATPSPGSLRGVRREDVALALRSAGVDAQIAGGALCRAKPKVELVPGSALEDAARRAVAAAFGQREVEIHVVRPVADLQVVAPELRRDLVADVARRDPQPGAWSVPVDVVVDGSRVQTQWIAIDVVLFEDRPVATRDVRRGEAVDASTWRLERVRVEASAQRSASESQLVGAVATRDLASGTQITENDVRRETLVRAGDMVELDVVRGSIRARSRAVARGQAGLGDRVEVQTGEGQRRLIGTVVQRGLVRVELAASTRNER